jgi:plasmid stability protein
MPSLTLRQLDDDLLDRLRSRAASHRRTVAAEVRAILEKELRPAMTGEDLVRELQRDGPWEIDFDAVRKETSTPVRHADFGACEE